MDSIIAGVTYFAPVAIFLLGILLWILIIRWERNMNWHIDNTITIEDVPAMKLRHVSDDPTLNAFGYGLQMMEDEGGIFERQNDDRPAYIEPLEGLTVADLFMDRKEFGEDDPSWNSITQMYDETR